MNTEIGSKEQPHLTLGIPADREISSTQAILSRLERPFQMVEVLVARWVKNSLTDSDLESLNSFFPTREIQSQARHAPAMRNAIVREARSTHILFLDDDMVPGSDLMEKALQLASDQPNMVHQGVPYHVANSNNWLARTEGKVYERSFKRYLNSDNTVSLLDARLMLAPVNILQETPFDESMAFGGGEGHELARCLMERGVPLKLAPDLPGAHINRDTIRGLIAQKRAHGRGRGYMLTQDGPGEKGWPVYINNYLQRHLIQPAVDWRNGDLSLDELMYVWGTYAVLWTGVLEEMTKLKIKKVQLNFF